MKFPSLGLIEKDVEHPSLLNADAMIYWSRCLKQSSLPLGDRINTLNICKVKQAKSDIGNYLVPTLLKHEEQRESSVTLIDAVFSWIISCSSLNLPELLMLSMQEHMFRFCRRSTKETFRNCANSAMEKSAGMTSKTCSHRLKRVNALWQLLPLQHRVGWDTLKIGTRYTS